MAGLEWKIGVFHLAGILTNFLLGVKIILDGPFYPKLRRTSG